MAPSSPEASGAPELPAGLHPGSASPPTPGSGRNGRRRRLSVSTVDPLKKDEQPRILGEPVQSSPSTSTTTTKIDSTFNLNRAVAAISRDETIATPTRRNQASGQPASRSPDAHRERRKSARSKERNASPSPSRDPAATLAVPSHPPRRGRRLSVSGRIAPEGNQQDYQLKEEAIKHSTDFELDTIKEQLVEMGIGYACHKGLKPESPNQDDFFIIRIDDWGLYGVFDGHGPFGHDVSNFVQREFPKQLYGSDFLLADPSRIGPCLVEGFEKVQKKLEAYCAQPSIRTCCSLSGTTASIVYHRIRENRLIVGHVGDSRVVLGRRNVNGSYTAIELAKDHKPENEEERKRIHERGGVVKRLAGDVPHRVFLRGKMFPGLAMSRALGDLVAHKAGVTCIPDILDYAIQPEDEFLILASDGVWEFIDSQECVDRIAKYHPSELSRCVEDVCEEAWNRWKQEEGDVVDDLTLEVVYLQPPN